MTRLLADEHDGQPAFPASADDRAQHLQGGVHAGHSGPTTRTILLRMKAARLAGETRKGECSLVATALSWSISPSRRHRQGMLREPGEGRTEIGRKIGRSDHDLPSHQEKKACVMPRSFPACVVLWRCSPGSAGRSVRRAGSVWTGS